MHTKITSLRKQAIQYSIETTYVLTQLHARGISTRKCTRVLSVDMHAKWKCITNMVDNRQNIYLALLTLDRSQLIRWLEEALAAKVQARLRIRKPASTIPHSQIIVPVPCRDDDSAAAVCTAHEAQPPLLLTPRHCCSRSLTPWMSSSRSSAAICSRLAVSRSAATCTFETHVAQGQQADDSRRCWLEAEWRA